MVEPKRKNVEAAEKKLKESEEELSKIKAQLLQLEQDITTLKSQFEQGRNRSEEPEREGSKHGEEIEFGEQAHRRFGFGARAMGETSFRTRDAAIETSWRLSALCIFRELLWPFHL